MTLEFVLIMILAVLCTVLSLLLYKRISLERKQNSLNKRMKLNEFSEFLVANSKEGSILDVAKRVSDLLINTFDCNSIIFLRKKRGLLELNFYHRIKNFNREELQIQYSHELNKVLRADFLPRNTDSLSDYLNDNFTAKLTEHKIDTFFPIFWRDNLYGIYFIKSNIETKTITFDLLIGALAQALSVAYHIKWHESKYESLQKQINGYTKITGKSQENNVDVIKVLKLLTNRKTASLIPRLISTLKDYARINGIALLYEDRDKSAHPLLIKENLMAKIIPPDNNLFEKIISATADRNFINLKSFKPTDVDLKKWTDNLRDNGINYIAPFPISSARRGIMLMDKSDDDAQIRDLLGNFQKHFTEIIENSDYIEMIEEMSYTDSLTGLANQRYFLKRIDEELRRAQRYNRSMGLVIFDVDELKEINDKYGHLAGDSLITEVGKILRKSVRAIDVVARYGGDEFCVIMPESNRDMCYQFMKRLLKNISAATLDLYRVAKPVTCTVSIGAGIYPDNGSTAKDLIFAADMALLRAKEAGRNQFVFADGELSSNQ